MTQVNSLVRSEIEALDFVTSAKITEGLDKVTDTKHLLKWEVNICTGCP